MSRSVLSSTLALTLLTACGCTTRLSEAQRLSRERDFNQKTVEKYGRLKLEGARKTEVFGSRTTEETSASVSISATSK